MAQELHVLKCFSCENFQTQIVKKTNKWGCKVCGMKQSIKKVYARGSGKDCRLHTQKLNAIRGALSDSKQDEEENTENVFRQSTQWSPTHSCATSPSSSIDKLQGFTKKSKWTEFIDEKKIDNDDDCNDDTVGITDSELKALPNKPLYLDSYPKKKRKHGKQKNSFKSPQEVPISYSGEFCNNIYLANSESNQSVNIKRAKTDEFVNTENFQNKCDINDVVEYSEEDFLMKSSKERELSRKNLEVKSVGKWGKYFGNVSDDESSLVSAANDFALEADDSVRENLSTPCSLAPTKVQFLHSCDKQTKYNNVDCKYNGLMDLYKFKKAHCENNSFNLKGNIPEDKIENKKLPGKIFEQDCDISDLDLELNF